MGKLYIGQEVSLLNKKVKVFEPIEQRPIKTGFGERIIFYSADNDELDASLAPNEYSLVVSRVNRDKYNREVEINGRFFTLGPEY